jgi:hypothetical protein
MIMSRFNLLGDDTDVDVDSDPNVIAARQAYTIAQANLQDASSHWYTLDSTKNELINIANAASFDLLNAVAVAKGKPAIPKWVDVPTPSLLDTTLKTVEQAASSIVSPISDTYKALPWIVGILAVGVAGYFVFAGRSGTKFF